VALPDVVSREEWLEARKRLLVTEKEQTRRRDALNAERRRLPMVRVEKKYLLEGPHGTVPLAALFDGCRQLIVQHVMFDPQWVLACPGCTASIDEISEGLIRHVRSRDTAFALVSRAPLEKLEKYRASRGWTLPWYSSEGTDFNYDFGATLDRTRGLMEYNYRPEPDMVPDESTSAEVPGFSCFLRDGDDIFHTYSTWARGTDGVGDSYALLDLTALGRQEDWEEPKGRAPRLHGADPTFTD
jgi:predicted dithiol-disulfide oxidoreductase (DUF899 family)